MIDTNLQRILAVLEAQNPWWRTPEARIAREFPHRRSEFQWLEQRTDSEARRACLVLGPRAVGKSVLLKQWIDARLDRGFSGRRLVYADLEEPLFPSGMTLEELRNAANLPEKAHPEPKYFVIDEVSRSAGEWGRSLRRFVDKTHDRYLVTDSASAVLAGAGVETGQGRFDELRVGGLTFRDFYFLYFSLGPEVADGRQDLDPLRASEACEAYLVRGGFPMHVRSPATSEARRLLRQDIAEKAIVKDLGRRTRGDPGFLCDLFIALAERSGDIFAAKSWAEDLQMGATRQRISAALLAFEMTSLIGKLPRYATTRRKQVGHHPKVYLTDPGLVSAFSRHGDPMSDPDTLGRLVECAVFTHLERQARLENASLSFWGSGNIECDFVVRLGTSTILVECAASREMDRRKGTGIAKVARKLRGVKQAFCVTRASHPTRHVYEGIDVEETPLWDFLDRLARRGLEGLLS